MGSYISSKMFQPPAQSYEENSPYLLKIGYSSESSNSCLSTPVSEKQYIPAFHFKAESTPITIIYSHGNATDIGLLFPWMLSSKGWQITTREMKLLFIVMYYRRQESSKNLFRLMLNGVQSQADLDHIEVVREHLLVEDSLEATLDALFGRLNSDVNPLMHKRYFISEHKLHTSMSVGDVVRVEGLVTGPEMWAVQGFGWKKIASD